MRTLAGQAPGTEAILLVCMTPWRWCRSVLLHWNDDEGAYWRMMSGWVLRVFYGQRNQASKGLGEPRAEEVSVLTSVKTIGSIGVLSHWW